MLVRKHVCMCFMYLSMYGCIFIPLMIIITLKRITFVCQSSAHGISPSNHIEGDREFILIFCAPLPQVAVSWSPPNNTGYMTALGTVIHLSSMQKSLLKFTTGTYLWRCPIMEHHIIPFVFILCQNSKQNLDER